MRAWTSEVWQFFQGQVRRSCSLAPSSSSARKNLTWRTVCDAKRPASTCLYSNMLLSRTCFELAFWSTMFPLVGCESCSLDCALVFCRVRLFLSRIELSPSPRNDKLSLSTMRRKSLEQKKTQTLKKTRFHPVTHACLNFKVCLKTLPILGNSNYHSPQPQPAFSPATSQENTRSASLSLFDCAVQIVPCSLLASRCDRHQCDGPIPVKPPLRFPYLRSVSKILSCESLTFRNFLARQSNPFLLLETKPLSLTCSSLEKCITRSI